MGLSHLPWRSVCVVQTMTGTLICQGLNDDDDNFNNYNEHPNGGRTIIDVL